MAYTLTNIYDSYIVDKVPVDRSLFKNICSEFNMMIMDYILEGKEWGESNKYKKELLSEGETIYDPITDLGVKWHIYHTDSFYCKYYWRKGKCSVPNKSVYRFDATRGIKGNKEKLINLLRTDDLAYLKFKK